MLDDEEDDEMLPKRKLMKYRIVYFCMQNQ